MEARTWLVAAAFGLAVGLVMGRFPQDRRPLQLAAAGSLLIGLVTWLVASESIAGPSLGVGGLVALLVMTLYRRKSASS